MLKNEQPLRVGSASESEHHIEPETSKKRISAVKVALSVGFAFFVVAFLLLIGAHGDGHGPDFVNSFEALVDFPVDLLGLSRNGAVFPATAFWGVVAGVLTFIALQIRDAFR